MSRFTITRNWAWVAPDRTLEFAGRCASVFLAIACAANVMLWWVAFNPGWFQAVISVGSALAAIGMVTRVRWPVSRISEEATWLAAMVWVAQAFEVSLADFVRPASKIRLGGIFSALALACFFVFIVERIALYNREQVGPYAVEK